MCILYVGIDPTIAAWVQKSLGNYHLSGEFACDVSQALILAHHRDYELVVIEVDGAQKSRLQLLGSLLELRSHRHVLYLIRQDAANSLPQQLGIDSEQFLIKPLRFTRFVARIRMLIKKNRRTQALQVCAEPCADQEFRRL